MNTKQTYKNPFQEMAVKERFRAQEATITALLEMLQVLRLPAGIDGIFERVQKGADYELRQALEEVEEYIHSTKMPIYLQDDARQKARESVDSDIREKLQPLLERLPKDITPGDLTTDDTGRIVFTEEFKKRTLEKECTFTLPDDVAADLQFFEKWLQDTEDLIARGYDLFSPAGILASLRLGKITNPAFVLVGAKMKK